MIVIFFTSKGVLAMWRKKTTNVNSGKFLLKFCQLLKHIFIVEIGTTNLFKYLFF